MRVVPIACDVNSGKNGRPTPLYAYISQRMRTGGVSSYRVVWVILEWACLDGPSVGRFIAYPQDGPTLKVSAAVTSALAPDGCEPCQFLALCVIHPIHGDSIIFPAHEKHLRNRLCSPGFLGTCS